MQTSDKKKMPDWLKAVCSVIIFAVCAVIILWAFMIPVEKTKDQDFNIAFVGGSLTKWGIDTRIINDETGKTSINMGVGPNSMIGRYYTLKGALDRYDLDTVVIDISYDAFENSTANSTVYNTAWVLPKMVTLKTAAEYCISAAKIPWYDYKTVIGVEMDEALNAWNHLIHGNYQDYYVRAGSDVADASNMAYTVKEAEEKHNSHKMNFLYDEKEIQAFRDMLQLCNDAGVRTIVLTTPITESKLWTNTGWDEYRDLILDILSDYDCEYYDINLMKDRKKYFYDECSFRDETHLSELGASKMSTFIASKILNQSSEDVDIEFYENYEQALEHSRYAG